MVANENRCPGFGLTTRWNGPGMLRQKQEEIAIRVTGRASDGANPGRSARSRYADQPKQIARYLGSFYPVLNYGTHYRTFDGTLTVTYNM